MSKSIKQETRGVLQDLPRTGLGDKIDHAIGGSIVFGAGVIFAKLVGYDKPALVGLIMTVFGAGLIEVLQKFSGGGRADFWDFVITIAPAVLLFTLAKFL